MKLKWTEVYGGRVLSATYKGFSLLVEVVPYVNQWSASFHKEGGIGSISYPGECELRTYPGECERVLIAAIDELGHR